MSRKNKISDEDLEQFFETDEEPPSSMWGGITPPPKIQPDKKNGQQTENKRATKREQTGNSYPNKQRTNREQTGNKNSKLLPVKSKTGNKQVTKRITKQVTIGEQTDNKQVTKSSFESLVGHEKNLLVLVFKDCLRVGALISPEMTLSFMAESLGCSTGTVKTVIYRLVKKGFLIREKSKTGRGGWIRFGIQKELYQDLRIRETDNNWSTNREQTDNKQVTKQVTKRVTSPPSSSSSNFNNKTTTTGTDVDNLINDTGFQMDSELLNLTDSQLAQIRQLVTSTPISHEVVKESVRDLAFDVENGKEFKKGPLNALFWNLRRGQGYFSEERSQLFNKHLEVTKQKLALRKAEVEKVFEEGFESWKQVLSKEKLDKLLKDLSGVGRSEAVQRALLKNHYELEVVKNERR